jgi:hypothetical protein
VVQQENQMNRHGKVLLAVLGVVFLVATGCQRQTASDTHAADEAAIRAADATTLTAAQAKDVDRVISNYAEDAVCLPPNAPMVQGKQSTSARAGHNFLLPLASALTGISKK